MRNFGNIIKTLQNIMRKDPGVSGDAQRIEQLGWMISLKILDDKDQEIELLIKEALLKLSPSIQLEIAKTPVDAEKKYLKLDLDFILCEFKTANLDKINQLYQKNDINAIPCALLIHEKAGIGKYIKCLRHSELDVLSIGCKW